MATILHIDTSTDTCSVAVSQDGKVIYDDAYHGTPQHASKLGTFVDEALSFADSHAIPVDAVSVSGGPGSYTGLRIGVSMAKGICYAKNIPLISVPTLQLMCVQPLLAEKIEEGALLCPMIDARRMEVYAAVYDRALREVRPVQADVVDADTYRELLDKQPIYFFGNGAKKCMDTINHPNARYLDGVEPLAKWMMPLAERKLMRGETEDVAYYVPFYLKDFVATKAKDLL